MKNMKSLNDALHRQLSRLEDPGMNADQLKVEIERTYSITKASKEINDAYEMFEYENEIWKVLGLDTPEYFHKDVVAEYLVDNKKFGFLIRANTPVPTFHSEDSASFSWGRYTENLFYADTFEEAFEQAKKWCIKYFESQKIKQTNPCASTT